MHEKLFHEVKKRFPQSRVVEQGVRRPQPPIKMYDLVIGKDVPELRDLSEPRVDHGPQYAERCAGEGGLVVTGQRGDLSAEHLLEAGLNFR